MVKECLVILNNAAVTVIRYDETEVQLPSIHRKADKVFVKYENGRYTIVEKPEPKADLEDKSVVESEEKEVIIKKPLKKIVKAEPSIEEPADREVIPENDIIADTE